MLDTHCEKNLIINGRELNYSGVFRAEELFAAINRALEERGYITREKKTEEEVKEEGRRTFLELRPYKEKTNYITLMLKLKIYLENVSEAVEEIKSIKRTFHRGEVKIIFDAWTLTDYESRWGMKPWAYFLKGLINKFMYTFPIEAGAPDELAADTAFVYGRARGLLDSYRGKEVVKVSEEEVRKKVEKEIRKEMREGLRKRK